MSNYIWTRFVLRDLMRVAKLPPNALEIFFLMVQHARDGNMVFLKSKQIARELGLKTSNTSRAIKHLQQKQFIERLDTGVYRLNKRYVICGHTPQRKPTKLPGLIDTSTGVIKRFKRAN